MEFLLCKHEIEASPLKMKDALQSMTTTRMVLDDTAFYVKSKTPTLCCQIPRLLRIKPPTTLTSEQHWVEWIAST